jgi:hypothetical protein
MAANMFRLQLNSKSVGKQSTKHWLMCQVDLDQMNEMLKTSKGNLMLWCDGKSDSPKDSSTGNRKRSSPTEPPVSKRQQIEDVEDYVTQLKEKHVTKYTIP